MWWETTGICRGCRSRGRRILTHGVPRRYWAEIPAGNGGAANDYQHKQCPDQAHSGSGEESESEAGGRTVHRGGTADVFRISPRTDRESLSFRKLLQGDGGQAYPGSDPLGTGGGPCIRPGGGDGALSGGALCCAPCGLSARRRAPAWTGLS